MIYLTSDWHFNHAKEFVYLARGFSSIEEMNEAIIERHNRIVDAADDVYVLGDLCLGDDAAAAELIARMNGRLHIALGNHDSNNRIALYEKLPNIADIQFAYRIKCGKWNFYATHYPTLTSNWDDGKTPGQSIVNLCGHVHTTDPFYHWELGKIYHCEMDAHQCAPVSIEEVKIQIREKFQEKV